MKSIIEEIFYGKCKNVESIDLDKAYFKVQSKSVELYEKLKKSLNEKQKKLLNKMSWSDAEQESEAIRIFYAEGFKTGFLIAVECFTK